MHMSPSNIETSSIVPTLSESDKQKAWARIIRFIFTDTLLSSLKDQNMITNLEYDRLSLVIEEHCNIPPNSIFRNSDSP